MTSNFGFTVYRDGDGWVVYLPNQEPHSGSFRITYEPATHQQAVAALHRFITEAQQALGALRDEQEWHSDDHPVLHDRIAVEEDA